MFNTLDSSEIMNKKYLCSWSLPFSRDKYTVINV